ncbi:MAG: RNA-binding domain-containing protein [archaeon]
MNIKESDTVELKKSLSQLERSLKTVCAFLNHKGGEIFFGISDKGEVCGQPAADSNIRKISQQICSRIKPPVVPIIEEIAVEGKPVIKLTIEKYDKELNYLDGIPYTRSGTETIVMPPDAVKKTILDCSRFEWDKDICEGSSFEDIDMTRVEKYLLFREKERNIPAKINMSQKEFLNNIMAVSGDKPTNAGMLFFGKSPLKYMHHAQLRIARIKGTKIFNTILDKSDCDGSLWDMVIDAENFIKRNIRYMGFRTDDFQRIDKYEYPLKALREAIINALIHRDYQNRADARVFIFDDRLEVVSPGTFPAGVSPEKPVHRPVNSILSNYMYDIGFIEKYGSGIYLENELCEKNGNDKPIYELGDIETKVIFKSQVRTISIETAKEKYELNERQKKALEYIAENGKITTLEYMELAEVSLKTAKRDISDLKDKKIIRFLGAPKTGYYVLDDPVNDPVKGKVKDITL